MSQVVTKQEEKNVDDFSNKRAQKMATLMALVHKLAADNVDDVSVVLKSLQLKNDLSKLEKSITEMCLLAEMMVFFCFQVAKSENVFLSAICTELLIRRITRDDANPVLVACYIRFEEGYALHVNCRIRIGRRAGRKSLVLHMDPGSRIYEANGLVAKELWYGDLPEKANLVDQFDKESLKEKRRLQVLFNLYVRNKHDIDSLLSMVAKSLSNEDLMALELVMGAGVFLTRAMACEMN